MRSRELLEEGRFEETDVGCQGKLGQYIHIYVCLCLCVYISICICINFTCMCVYVYIYKCSYRYINCIAAKL